VNVTPVPTVPINSTTGMALNLILVKPINPKVWTTSIADMTSVINAACKLHRNNKLKKNKKRPILKNNMILNKNKVEKKKKKKM